MPEGFECDQVVGMAERTLALFVHMPTTGDSSKKPALWMKELGTP